MSVTATATVKGRLTFECSVCPQLYTPGVNDRAHYIADWVYAHTTESHLHPRDDAKKTCKHCLRPIVWETRHLQGEANPRVDWWDDTRTDQHICFRALNYVHSPQEETLQVPPQNRIGEMRAEGKSPFTRPAEA